MNDFNQYIIDATRTESRISEVVTHEDEFLTALKIFIISSQLLDLFKRQIFYKKPFPEGAAKDILQQIHNLSADKPFNSETKNVPLNTRVLHASLGFSTEAGEFLEAIVKTMDGTALDKINLIEEIGDLNWYQAIVLDEMNIELQDVLDRNIAKLKARFPQKFLEKDAVERDLVTERKALENSDE